MCSVVCELALLVSAICATRSMLRAMSVLVALCSRRAVEMSATTPTSRAEFLIGKMLPYVGMAMLNFLLMSLAAVTVFGVPVSGSFLTLAAGALIFSGIATSMGLLASTVTSSQIAAMFFAMLGTMLPAIQFSGLLNTVSSLEGAGRLIGEIYPTTHMLIITRGVFNKALGLADLYGPLISLLATVPVVMGLAVLMLRKQEG